MNPISILVKKAKFLCRKVLNERVARGLLSLIAGSAAAKIITLAAMPVLTRIYTPENFGALALFVSMTAIVAPTLTLRYVSAIPLPRTERRANHLLLMSALILVLMSLVAIVLAKATLFLGVISFFTTPFWKYYWWTIPVGSVAIAFYELLTMSAMRQRNYGVIAKSQITQALTATAIKLLGGILGLGNSALIAGQTIQHGGGIITMLRPFMQSMKLAVREWNLKYLWLLAKYYSDFVKYRLPSHFIFVYSAQAPIILSTLYWSGSETGQLSIAFLAISLPIGLIGQNAGKIYYSELSQMTTKAEAICFTNGICRKLFVSGSTLGFILAIGGPLAFSFVFGEKWNTAGELARAMAITIPFQLVASTIISAYNVYGNQRKVLLIHAIRAALVTVLIASAARADFDLLEVMYMYSAIISLHYCLIWRNVVTLINSHNKEKK